MGKGMCISPLSFYHSSRKTAINKGSSCQLSRENTGLRGGISTPMVSRGGHSDGSDVTCAQFPCPAGATARPMWVAIGGNSESVWATSTLGTFKGNLCSALQWTFSCILSQGHIAECRESNCSWIVQYQNIFPARLIGWKHVYKMSSWNVCLLKTLAI